MKGTLSWNTAAVEVATGKLDVVHEVKDRERLHIGQRHRRLALSVARERAARHDLEVSLLPQRVGRDGLEACEELRGLTAQDAHDLRDVVLLGEEFPALHVGSLNIRYESLKSCDRTLLNHVLTALDKARLGGALDVLALRPPKARDSGGLPHVVHDHGRVLEQLLGERSHASLLNDLSGVSCREDHVGQSKAHDLLGLSLRKTISVDELRHSDVASQRRDHRANQVQLDLIGDHVLEQRQRIGRVDLLIHLEGIVGQPLPRDRPALRLPEPFVQPIEGQLAPGPILQIVEGPDLHVAIEGRVLSGQKIRIDQIQPGGREAAREALQPLACDHARAALDLIDRHHAAERAPHRPAIHAEALGRGIDHHVPRRDSPNPRSIGMCRTEVMEKLSIVVAQLAFRGVAVTDDAGEWNELVIAQSRVQLVDVILLDDVVVVERFDERDGGLRRLRFREVLSPRIAGRDSSLLAVGEGKDLFYYPDLVVRQHLHPSPALPLSAAIELDELLTDAGALSLTEDPLALVDLLGPEKSRLRALEELSITRHDALHRSTCRRCGCAWPRAGDATDGSAGRGGSPPPDAVSKAGSSPNSDSHRRRGLLPQRHGESPPGRSPGRRAPRASEWCAYSDP